MTSLSLFVGTTVVFAVGHVLLSFIYFLFPFISCPSSFFVIYTCEEIIRIYHECEGGIEKSVPRITDWQNKPCQVMTNGDHEGRIDVRPACSFSFFIFS